MRMDVAAATLTITHFANSYDGKAYPNPDAALHATTAAAAAATAAAPAPAQASVTTQGVPTQQQQPAGTALGGVGGTARDAAADAVADAAGEAALGALSVARKMVLSDMRELMGDLLAAMTKDPTSVELLNALAG